MIEVSIRDRLVLDALDDLVRILRPVAQSIVRVFVVGSATKVSGEVRDIDFLVAYRNLEYQALAQRVRRAARDSGVARMLQIECLEQGYSNCPSWPKSDPPAIHLLLFEEGRTSPSQKLLNWRATALDVTRLIKERGPERAPRDRSRQGLITDGDGLGAVGD